MQRNVAEPSDLPAAVAPHGTAESATPQTMIPRYRESFMVCLPFERALHAHRVAAARHARAECPVVGGVPLRHGALLLRLIGLLLLLLLVRPPGPSHEAEEAADGGPDRSALARIASDRTTDCTHGRAACRTSEQPTLWSRRLRGRWRVHLRVRRIEAALLHGPAVALPFVELLLLWALAARGIDEDLGYGREG